MVNEMAIEAKAKKWGNSVGIIIPAEAVARLRIHQGETLQLELRKTGSVLRDMFGSSRSKRKTKDILKEVRQSHGSGWLR